MILVVTIFVVIIAVALVLFSILLSVLPLIMRNLARPEDETQALANGRELYRKAKVVLAVGAHPDDIEWYAGGTLATLKLEGKKVVVVIMADGGSEQLIRQQEQLRAADILGYKKIVFFGYRDGALEKAPREELVSRLGKVIDEVKPDTVIAYDSEKENLIYRHPDHRASGLATIEAARKAGIPHVYLYHSRAPDTWTDVSKGIDLKLKGLKAHQSQQEGPMQILSFLRFLSPLRMDFNNRRWGNIEGSKIGLDYAEPFRKLSK